MQVAGMLSEVQLQPQAEIRRRLPDGRLRPG
jgi:hypothetical protein